MLLAGPQKKNPTPMLWLESDKNNSLISREKDINSEAEVTYTICSSSQLLQQ